MSVVASVAINVDSRDAAAKLRQFQQQSTAAGRAAEQLQQGATAAGQAAQGAGRQFQTAANGLKYYIDATGRARKENGQFVSTVEAAAAGIEKQGNAASKAAGAMRSLGGVIASIGAGALVAGMVRGAAAAEQLQLRLKVLSAEYGETARIQQFVSDSAKTFGQSQTEAAAGVADVYARLRPLGISLDKIETVYKGFNATALASGTSAEAASGAFLQLSQALGSGRLQGDEFSSVAEQVPGILRLVAGEMGVAVGELKKLGSEGKITSDILINALAKGFDENSSKIKALLDQSPAQRFKEFKDSTQALSNALGSELLPAIVPIVKQATELLRLFGSLPGPVKTLAAAVLGVTAAFVALAPAISAVIGLLGPAGIAGLIAAGPWIALAAGIGAATVALAGYRTESQKLSQSVGAAARSGNAADLTTAERRALVLEKQISEAEKAQAGAGATTNARTGQGARRGAATNAAATTGGRAGAAGGGGRGGGQRSAAGTSLAAKRAELAQLQRDIAQGKQAAAAAKPPVPDVPVPTPTPTPDGTDKRKGGGADKAASEAAQLQSRLRGLQIETQGTLQLALIKGKIAEAEMAGNKELAIRLQGEQRNQQILLDLQRSLEGVTDEREKQALLTRAQAELESAGMDTAIEMERRRLELIKEQNDELFKRAGFTPQDKMRGGAGAFDPSLPDLRVSPAEQQMAKYREELAALTNPINMAVTGADAIGNAFGQAFQDIATGAKSTQEALADAFKGIGEAFIQMATQIIAKQLAMIAFQTILKALGGGGGGFGFSGAGPAALPSGDGFAAGFSMPALLPGRANGGPVTSGSPYIVGERGPELFVPSSSGSVMSNADTRAALAEQSAARSTNDTRDALTEQSIARQTNDTRAMLNQQTAARQANATGMALQQKPIDVRYESTVINQTEYVTAEQHRKGLAQAAERGRALTLAALQNSTRTRKKVGI